MKKFALSLFVFVVSVGFLIACELALSAYVLKKSTLYIPINKTVLVLGDSNAQNAFNDSVLTNYFNVSSLATSYLYSYAKLNQILEKNSQIDTVILAFSPHNVFQTIEHKWLLNPKNFNRNIPFYFSIMGYQEYIVFLENNPSVFFQALPTLVNVSFKNILKGLMNKDIDLNYGSFGATDSCVVDKAELHMRAMYRSKQNTVLSKIELSYIRKISDLCVQRRVKLILFNTPKTKIHLEITHQLQKPFYDCYANQFSDIEFIDMVGCEIPATGFHDTYHLNKKGALQFSTYLRDLSPKEWASFRVK